MESISNGLAARQPFAESYDTALCLVPPRHLWAPLDRLRCNNDKAYDRWPPHINLIYPFVRPGVLSEVAETLCQLDLAPDGDISISLQEPGTFIHKHHNTIFLRPASDQGTVALSHVRNQIRRVLGWPQDEAYQPHLTVAQSEDSLAAWHSFLLEKARLLTPLTWHASQLAILVRDPAHPGGDAVPRQMRLWGFIDLASHCLTRETASMKTVSERAVEATRAHPQVAYRHVQTDRSWQRAPDVPSGATVDEDILGRLVVASYNVLAEFDWPPNPSRYPALVANILSDRAAADILVLQEVTDQFLVFLLADAEVSSRYPFSTHGPPDHPGVGPLPSLLNLVVLSRLPLQWEHLASPKRHKGFAIVTFPTFRTSETHQPVQLPLVLAACHLSQGLADGAIAAKRNELHTLINHLSTKFSRNPWVVAGDFNLTTSSHTIVLAQKRHDISAQGLQYSDEIIDIISKAGLQDAWLVTRVGSGESSSTTESQEATLDLYEGEQGATFDPLSNSLTARSVDSDHNNRPQRYDRILVNDHLPLRPCGFNMFGQATIKGEHNFQGHASDHWGIRCLLLPSPPAEGSAMSSNRDFEIDLCKAPQALGGFEALKSSLVSRGCFPTPAGEALRKETFTLLESILLVGDQVDSIPDKRASIAGVVLIPVGSFGLGVWTASSDMDCLCVGSISSKTFFALAVQRLRKAAAEGVTILRRVSASSGIMLELAVRGIKFDLQYCAAMSIAEGYPNILKRPSSDPAFALPLQTLSKLKPACDLYYLRRSIPDMATYRVAHLFIKAWAKSRGLYAAKFGLLGGIHISAMLVPVCKVLSSGGGTMSTADIVMSFFQHYANFDWKTRLVFDPFFHNDLRYHRTFREPLCLLGWHSPSLNTAPSASVPTVKILATELTRASTLLSREGMSWDAFLGPDSLDIPSGFVGTSVAEFLRSYKSYVKIDARYWGSSPNKGRKFVGWLESKCISMLVDIDRKVPALTSRIWPARFVEGDSAADLSDGAQEYHGCYLIGLEWNDSSPDERLKTEISAAKGSMDVILRDFESRIRGDSKYYDSISCWMMASVVKGRDLSFIQLDRGQWCDHDPADSDSDEGLDFQDDEAGKEEEDTASELCVGARKKMATLNKDMPPAAVKPPGAGKLRSAVDVMNRLRWDATLNSSDYVVGYEDRFVGAREKSLEQWKTEQTDEEFIPQHRILYFKRKSDEAIVWERRTRVDKIFGSG